MGVTFNQEGDRVPGKIPADIAFIIRDKPHPIFSRDGSNILYTYKIPLRDAICGSVIQVPTLEGKKVGINCTGEVIKPTTTKRLQAMACPTRKSQARREILLWALMFSFPMQFPRVQRMFCTTSSHKDNKTNIFNTFLQKLQKV